MKNTGITLTDVRNEAFEAIQKLKSNEMDIKTAAEIRNMLTVITEANIFEAIIEGFNEAESTNLKLGDITNLDQAQGWVDEFLEKYSA